MSKMYKILLAILVVGSISFNASAQDQYWTVRADKSNIITDKAVARLSFPTMFKTFDLNIEPLRQELFTIVNNQSRHSTVISLPNAAGNLEQFEVVEASNFDPALQARFPQIRAFSGRGITDRASTLKLSISPQGIQTMVFRSGSENEYIEPYSQDRTVYAVFKSQRAKGQLPWVCSTPDQDLASSLNARVNASNLTGSSAGELKTMRLAQSCNGEYSNFFGATSSAQVGLVLAAFNATITRCNGCYEKDLALHLNLIANTDLVIFYDPSTDPYTTLGQWNNQLQTTLTNIIGEANYDIGHMFGASGGGGNAGCIGCVCDAGKGRGITSPADGIPQGDNFDIDYVAHEVGHQLGGNHTFSHQNEGTGVNKEVGSGITIMGYAGITGQDVAPHSIDIFHEASIDQIQANLAGKSCPITTNINATNATPVVAPVPNYTIPISTPFALTGSATDANAGDVLTYCWEQNDNSTTTGNASVASPTKLTGPNWLSFKPTTSPTRICPILPTILAGNNVTGPLPGGDAIANIEALSSVGRTLNFRLTVRDNSPYSSTAPVKVGQTSYTDMVVTVSAAAGPFQVTSPNTNLTWNAGSNQTITWDVNNTTAAPVNCANVKISYSSDGGLTFPVVLAASTPNDGSEVLTMPASPNTTSRIKIEAIGNIFFDISNANFTLAVPPVGFSFGATSPAVAACPAPANMTVTIPTISNGGFVTPINLTATAGVPAGHTVTFAPNPVVPGNNTVATLNPANDLPAGSYVVTVQGIAGAVTVNTNITFTINTGTGPTITTQPVSQAICSGGNVTFTAAASTGTYQWQLSTNGGGTWNNVAGQTAASYTITGVTTALNNNQYRVLVTGQCGVTTSNVATLTVNTAPAITGNPASLNLCSGSSASFTVTATGTGLGYQWEVSTNGGGLYTPIGGATASTYTIASTTVGQNNNLYRAVVTGTCPSPVTSTAATLLVSASITITTNPSPQTVCEATSTSFTVAAGGSGLSYQWQVSTDGGTTYNNIPAAAPYSGTTTATLNITNVPPSLNGYRYRAIVSNGACTPGISSGALLTVNTFPSITTQPVNVTICEGANASFSVAAVTGVGALSYQWQLSTNGGGSWSNIAGETNATFAQTGVLVGENGYRFRVIVTAGCGSVTSNAVILTVNAYPVISFNPPATVCVSDTAVYLVASPSGGVFSGPSMIGGNAFYPSVAGVGPKTITYTVSNAGCQSVATRTINVNECAERHLRLEDYPAVFVYPNPNNGDFRIRLNTDLYTKLNIKIFNSMGQLVKSEIANGLSYGSIIPVHLFNVPSGTYHVFLSNDERGGVSRRGLGMVIYKP